MSSYEQDSSFGNFMNELNGLYEGSVDADSLMLRIRQAFEDNELTTLQYDKLVRECGDFIGDE